MIHTDFEKGFIRAEVMAFADYVAHKGEAGCRSAGVFRVEGKEYVVQDDMNCPRAIRADHPYRRWCSP